MSNQLIKTTGQGKENVFPRTRIQDLFDDTSGQKLIDILRSFNMMFVPYLGNKSYTRNQISPELRRQGLWLTYVIDNTVYTEWYGEVAIDDTNWGSDSNWRQGSNALVGDLSISPNGTWVINGEDSGITIKGDKGDSPVIRIYNNRIQVSYDKGITYEDLNNTPIYTKFRFNSQTNTYQVSYDLGANWEDISDEKVYHKFKYNQATNTYQESTDFGKTWSNISAEKVYTKFRFNRSTNTYQVSTNLGQNWTDVSSDKVYYQFRYNGETNTHQVSTDFGTTWTNVSEDKVFYQFRTEGNRLQVSTDLGTTWENCSEPIAAWFRWADASGTGNVGKVQISRDNKTWSDLSPTITNNLYIKGYIDAIGNLPSNAAIGDIYMVGPTYDESDATHDYPHYRMWVKQSSGWVDNGEFTNAGPVSTSNIINGAVTIEKLDDRAIDNEPIAESENLVKSGGILAWGEENYGKYAENSDYIDIKEDSEGKLLEGTRTDGTKQLSGDLIIYGTINGENIQDKVNKEKGKGLSTNDFNNNEKEIVDMNFLSEKNDIQQIVDAEDKILSGFDKHGNPFYKNEDKNFKNCLSRKKYLGVIVWDGGSPSTSADVPEVDTISNEQYTNSSIYDPNYPNWRDYVKHVYGKYPPKMCSFATFFNTNTDIESSRKPIDTLYSETVGGNVNIGWWYSGYIEKTKDTNPGTLHETEKVEAQIDLASDYDIDYFAICFFCESSYFNNDGSINELLLKTRDENNFLYQYMASRNKWKIRFCLLLFISSLNKQQTYTFMKYINDNFLSDPQYLYVNGAPIVLCYSINFALQNYNFVRFKGCNMIANRIYNKLDGAFAYNFGASSKNMKFNAFSTSNLNSWNALSNKENYFFAFPISTGIDDRGRYGYTTEKALSRNYAEKPTEAELYNALIDIISLANKRCQSDIMIIIYAWSEFIEGGWVLPTQADIDNGNGTFRLEAIKKAKNFLSNNY